MNKKLEWLECIRGEATLLVVLGHLTLINGVGAYSEIIYQFHMPLFFAISGFLFGYKEIDKKISPSDFVKKKIMALGIPYFVFSVVYICFNVGLQKFIQTNTVVNIKNIFLLIWRPVAHYWFIWVLIIYFIVVAHFGNTIKKLETLAIVGTAVTLMETIIPQGWSTAYHNGLAYFFYFVVAAMIGCVFIQKNIKELVVNRYTIAGLAISIIIFVLLNIDKNTLGETSIRATLLRISGINAFSIGIVFICNVDFVKKVLMRIGEYSWHIYLLHTYFLCFVRAVLKHFIPRGNQVIEVTMGLLFSVSGCMVIGFVSKQYKWVDGIFYPQHLEKTKKSRRCVS